MRHGQDGNRRAYGPSLRRGSRGQGLVEYALALALVAILAIGSLAIVGGGVSDALDGIGSSLAAGSPATTVDPHATPTPKPTKTPKPAPTPKPTKTPKPAPTPKPTKTPKP